MKAWKIALIVVAAFAAGAALPTTPIQALWWDSGACRMHYLGKANSDSQYRDVTFYCQRFNR